MWFDFFDQYVGIFNDVLYSSVLSIIVVTGVMFGFIANAPASLLLMFTSAMVLVDSFGCMYLVGIQLNGFSVVNLLMSTALAVEYSAHIVLAYLVAQDSNGDGSKADRQLESALGSMAMPTVNGAVSSFVGIFALAFGELEVFRIFYFRMFTLIIVVAFVHGIIFVPMMLSVFRPKTVMW